MARNLFYVPIINWYTFSPISTEDSVHGNNEISRDMCPLQNLAAGEVSWSFPAFWVKASFLPSAPQPFDLRSGAIWLHW